MRIIQKIKNFKRMLNFFDLAMIFLLLMVVVFFAYNRLQRETTWENIRISVENPDWWYRGSPPAYWYARNLQVGDSIQDSFGNKVAEITNIDNYDSYGPYREIYVDLKVKTDYDKKKKQNLYEFKPLVVGSSLLFNFSKEQLRGLVVKIGDQETEYFYKTIVVEKKKISPALAEKIVIGSKSYDSDGNLIAEIVDVKNNTNSYYEFSDSRGKNIEVYDYDFRDVEVTLRIKSFADLGRIFYINKAALKIGNMIWFQFPEFALEDTKIIEIIN